jgi:mitochondrial FAD-linked sulfhydryl oxidase
MSYHTKHKKRHNGGKSKSRAVNKSKSSDTSKRKRDPKRWGPIFWEFLTYVVDTYPKKPTRTEQRAIRLLFSSQKFLLPCITCAENYRKIYKANPPQTQSRSTMQAWLALLKQEVAKHTKKQ